MFENNIYRPPNRTVNGVNGIFKLQIKLGIYFWVVVRYLCGMEAWTRPQCFLRPCLQGHGNTRKNNNPISCEVPLESVPETQNPSGGGVQEHDCTGAVEND